MVISVGFEKNVKNAKKGFKKSKHGNLLLQNVNLEYLTVIQ